MSKLLKALLEKKQVLLAASSAITTKAGDEGRELTADELKAVNENLAAVDNLAPQIAAETRNIEAMRTMEIPRAPNAPAAGRIEGMRDNREEDPAHGFRSFGDFALAVRSANDPSRRAVDERLLIGAASPGSTTANENAGADGGYLVPTEFANNITAISLDHDAFLPLCENIPVSGNSVTFPSDETTPWGSNGIRIYWAAEAAAATATKPLIKPNQMRLNKLLGLVPITDELLADAPAMGGYLQSSLGRSIKWKVNDAIMNGTGAGMPLGILQAPGLVTVSKESGQATLTLLPANVAKMYAAMPADYLAGAVWVITPDLLPQLMTMVLGNMAIWTPPMQGFAGAPGGFLFGKPVLLSQTCQAFSSKGDIVFVNFKAYRTISKDGVQIAESMHLYFDYDSTAYRATFRVDGQPTFKQAVTQARGVQPLSPYVTLQAR
jgi:HK97 family phage major capsid protein